MASELVSHEQRELPSDDTESAILSMLAQGSAFAFFTFDFTLVDEDDENNEAVDVGVHMTVGNGLPVHILKDLLTDVLENLPTE